MYTQDYIGQSEKIDFPLAKERPFLYWPEKERVIIGQGQRELLLVKERRQDFYLAIENTLYEC